MGGNPWGDSPGAEVLERRHLPARIGDPGFEGPDSNDTNGATTARRRSTTRPTSRSIPRTNELYIADGYGNHRIVVVDAETGLYKRHWGAYGQNPVDDVAADAVGDYAEDRDAGIVPQYFRNPVHCVRVTEDRKVYVCDRVNNRIQVFADRRHLHQGMRFVESSGRTRWATARSGISTPRPIGARAACTTPTARTRSSTRSIATARGHRDLRDRTAAMPASSTGSTTWRPTRTATSTPPRSTPVSAPRSSIATASAAARSG